MKRLILPILLLLSTACSDDFELFNPREETEDYGQFLRSDETFEAAFNVVLQAFSEKREELGNAADPKSLSSENGVLKISSAEQFQTFYMEVSALDSIWSNLYEEKVVELITLVQSDEELAASAANEEEIGWTIEDLLEEEDIDPDIVMKDLANAMPINTLWATVYEESEVWLADQEGNEAPNWEESPEASTGIERIGRLFVNQENAIIIEDSLQFIEDEVSIGNGNDGLIDGRVEGSGCRFFRSRIAWGDNKRTCIRLRVYVNNWSWFANYGASTKGWIYRRGKWRPRRFWKNLSASGNVVANGLFRSCDPDKVKFVSHYKVSRRRGFAIKKTAFGVLPTWVGLCQYQFGGGTSGRNVIASVTMD